jgi:F-type H+-transporting ATPase subunit b
MEEIINAFGIDARLIAIQLVNFSILMVVLGYFLYQPILRILKEREDKIAQGLKDAEAAAEAKSQAGLEKQIILSAAHKEAEEVGKRAKLAADSTASEIVGVAQEKAVSVLQDAELKGEQLKAQAKAESEKEIAQVAILAAEKILRQKPGV